MAEKVLAKLVGGTAHARREQRPANEQRPPGNPEEEKEGPGAVTEFDGEFVQSRDFITATERPEVLDEINDDMSSDEFQCDECDRTFKTERGKTAHMVAKHSDDGGSDSESDEDKEDIALMDEQAEADAEATEAANPQAEDEADASDNGKSEDEAEDNPEKES
jgi:hypothetical protein